MAMPAASGAEIRHAFDARSFYSVADREYFLGAVALINSLRLVGHRERMVILDCGLAEEQRDLLGREATIVTVSQNDLETLPRFLLRDRAPLLRPAETMILLDADIIVTRSLEPIFKLAQAGKIIAFDDPLGDRFKRSGRRVSIFSLFGVSRT